MSPAFPSCKQIGPDKTQKALYFNLVFVWNVDFINSQTLKNASWDACNMTLIV